MQVMTTPLASQAGPTPGSLLRRLALVFAMALVASIAFAVLYLVSPGLLPEVLALVAPAGVGLVGGFAARWALPHRRGLRLAAAVAAVTLAMAFLGWLTWGMAGLVVIHLGRPLPDWQGLAQLVLACGASWLALTAWHRPSAEPAGAPSPPPTTGPIRSGVGRFGLIRLARGLPALRIPESLLRRRRAGARRVRQRVAIRLTGRAEDRCPYCLEIVLRRDPRGVVTCPECHTRHHADCWAVTGVCQVPHHHR